MTGDPARALSLNEVEQLGLKAARGAGTSWGVAEDLGRAARWLAARGVHWAPSLLDLLEGDPPAAAFVQALAVGDRIGRATPGDRWTVAACPPGWLLAVLAAARPALPLIVTWPEGRAVLHPAGNVGLGRPADGLASGLGVARVEARADAAPLPCPLRAVTRRGTADQASLAALEALALRTAVPATARSRAAGAGGGRVDDD